jgi:hypothetical protein
MITAENTDDLYQNDISIKSSNVKLNISDVCNLIEHSKCVHSERVKIEIN